MLPGDQCSNRSKNICPNCFQPTTAGLDEEPVCSVWEQQHPSCEAAGADRLTGGWKWRTLAWHRLSFGGRWRRNMLLLGKHALTEFLYVGTFWALRTSLVTAFSKQSPQISKFKKDKDAQAADLWWRLIKKKEERVTLNITFAKCLFNAYLKGYYVQFELKRHI